MSQEIGIERRLAAVLAADVAGFSRLTEADEVGTMRMLAGQRAILDGAIARHRGRIANTAGDSVLAEFPSAVNAVQCAVEAQHALRDAAEGVELGRRVLFRIGIHVGDVMVRGGDLLGNGVNMAARLEALADAGGIVLSAAAHEQVKKILPLAYTDLGPQNVKNIEEPVRAFAIGTTAFTASVPPEPGKPLPLPDKPSIAVLPFQNLSGDPEQEYFADGIVEDIITALSRFKSLFVIARNSSFSYKGMSPDIRQVGRELGVRYVLEGSVRKAGGRVRITGQLIEAASGSHIWAGRFDREMSDVFAIQDEVTESVIAAIEPKLRLAEIARKSGVPTKNLHAYDLYLRALPQLELLDLAGLKKAEGLLRRAVELDPNYSDAWAGLADTFGRQVVGGWKTEAEGREDVFQAALTASRLDPDNGAAFAVLAWALAVFGGSLDEAQHAANRAIEVHGNSAVVRALAGWAFVYCGEFDRAIDSLAIARRMNPLDPRLHQTDTATAAAHFFQRRFDETLRLTGGVLARAPNHPISLRYRIAALVHLDRLDEASQAARQLLATNQNIALSKMRAYFRHSWMKEMLIGALRRAGIPE